MMFIQLVKQFLLVNILCTGLPGGVDNPSFVFIGLIGGVLRYFLSVIS
jgi:hypothetical protein